MAVDLKCVGWFNRRDILVMEDHIAVLEAEGNDDFVKRIYFDKVKNVVIRRDIPLGRFFAVAFVSALLCVPLLFIPSKPTQAVSAAVLLVLLGIAFVRAFIWRRTHFRFQRGPSLYAFSSIVSPAKIRGFTDKIVDAIRRFQEEEQVKITEAPPPPPRFPDPLVP